MVVFLYDSDNLGTVLIFSDFIHSLTVSLDENYALVNVKFMLG